MTLKEITEKFSGLGIYDQRTSSDEYSELVFFNEEIDKWNKIFSDILGPPEKPAGENPTEDDQCLAEDHGGIYRNQTLFKKELDDAIVIAMFWPWQDNKHTTLKVIFIKK